MVQAVILAGGLGTGLRPLTHTRPSGAGEDLIEYGKNGFLINDVNNPEEIADKILILAEDKKLRKIMGKAARKTAQICSWNNIAERTMKVYEGVLRR